MQEKLIIKETTDTSIINETLLGRPIPSPMVYSPEILHVIPRSEARDLLGFSKELPFNGADIWNIYELSWLNTKGKPLFSLLQLTIPCVTPYMIESKSLKLYFNSFSETVFNNSNSVQRCIQNDLTAQLKCHVGVDLYPAKDQQKMEGPPFKGRCLDDVDITVSDYRPSPSYLKTSDKQTREKVYSHLFKSLCPVTAQPDWACIHIHYHGQKIDHEGLLRYLISFRHHQCFHEHLVERIYQEILTLCQPQKLSVKAFFKRRGGISINPFRSNFEEV